VAFSPDGRTLVTGGYDDRAILWDLTTWKPRHTLKHSNAVIAAGFSPDGKLLATGSTDTPEEGKPVGAVRVWDPVTGKELMSFKGELLSNPVYCVSFSPDGRTIAAGSPTPRQQRLREGNVEEGEASLWDLETKQKKAALGMPIGPVYALAFSPAGDLLATATGDLVRRKGLVIVWDVATKKVKQTIRSETAPIYALAFSPDGKTLATGGGDLPDLFQGKTDRVTELALWDWSTGKVKARLKGGATPVYAVAFSPDGKFLASGGGDPLDELGELRLWDVVTCKEVMELKGHENLVKTLAFSPDGKMLASGSHDTTVRVWDLAKSTGPNPDKPRKAP
jgi:WD40 repeat protein